MQESDWLKEKKLLLEKNEMYEIFDVELLRSALRMAIPLILAAFGGLLCERSGVVNIALEGMILAGAFFGVLGSYYTGNAWLGMLAGMLSGGIMGAMHAILTQKMKMNHIVSGVAFNILALGSTTYLLRLIYKNAGGSPYVSGLPVWRLGLFEKIPFFGPLFGSNNVLFYLTILIGIGLSFLLFKTPTGLRIRAIGENPNAASSAGIAVKRLRYITIIISGILGGLSGVYLSLGNLNMFTEGMSGGRGYIALAVVIFGKWSPSGVVGAAIFFGFFDALQMRLQGQDVFGISIPSEFMLMIPYFLTIIVLAGFLTKSVPPASLGVNDDD